jgi:hypothetical protein
MVYLRMLISLHTTLVACYPLLLTHFLYDTCIANTMLQLNVEHHYHFLETS